MGLESACAAVGISRATWYRWQSAPPAASTRADERAHPRALSDSERARVLAVLCSERFAHASPHAVHAALLDEGEYLASVSTMYRVLREAGQPRPRSHRLRRPPGDVVAEQPDLEWVRLLAPVPLSDSATPGQIALVADAFSRCPLSWSLTGPYSDVDFERRPSGRVVTIRAESWASLMAELGIHRDAIVDPAAPVLTIGHGQAPRNLRTPPVLTMSEATLRDLDRVWAWFGHEYRHPELGYYTPHQVYSGAWVHTWRARAATLAEAYSMHPERFVNQPPLPQTPPGVRPPDPGRR